MQFAHQYTISAVDILYDYEGSVEAGTSYHRIIDRIAPIESPVIISGESGLLKESVLRTIHSRSPRSNKACLSISPGFLLALIKSGIHSSVDNSSARTPASGNGFFERGDGGSIILCRLHEFTAEEQSLVAALMESPRAKPLGNSDPVPFAVRLMCCAHPDAVTTASAVAAYVQKAKGSLISVLPLRSTPEDIPRLSQKLLSRQAPRKYFGENVLAALREYDWRLNLAQLMRLIYRLHAAAPGDILELRDLKAALSDKEVVTDE